MIVKSTLFSDMNGSVSGLTFFKSPAGIVARMKNSIIRNDSLAVKQSRLLFASSFDGWNQLTGVQRSAWDSWALSNYSSASHPSGHATNGYNAYRGVYSLVRNFLSKVTSFTIYLDPFLLTRTYVQTAFNYSILPSLVKVNNSIQDPGNPSKILFLSTCSLNSNGQTSFIVNFNQVPLPLVAGQQFVNTSGVKFGFMVYLSDSGNSVSFIPKNPLHNCVFSSGLFSVNTPFLTGAYTVKLTFDITSLMSGSKYGVQSGRYYSMSVFTIGENGTASLVGSRNVLCI